MSSIPNSYIDDLRSIVLATLNRIEQLRMRVLFGVQFVKGAYGQELEFRSNGYSYIDGVLITGGGTGDFMADGSVPMTGDLSMNNNNLANVNTVNGRTDAILQITSNYQTLRLNAVSGYDIVMGDPVAMGANKITGLGAPTADTDAATKGYADALPGVDGVSFIIDQDNAGAGVSSSLRFNRGSTDGDAAIWWNEGDDEFQFESDVGVTVGSILIDECRHGGSVKTSRNPSTGDYEIEVATGDSIVFKAV